MKLPEGVLGKLLAIEDCWTLWATRADAGDAACAAGAGAVRLCDWRTLTRGAHQNQRWNCSSSSVLPALARDEGYHAS